MVNGFGYPKEARIAPYLEVEGPFEHISKSLEIEQRNIPSKILTH